MRLQADDTSVVAFKDLAFSAYATPVEQWQGTQFAATGGLSDPLAALSQDPDHDGLSNLMEYALGIDPEVAGTTNGKIITDVEPVSAEKYLRMTVVKNPAATDVVYIVEATSTLGDPLSWRGSGLVVETDDASTLRVRDIVPMSTGTQRFMRLRVTKP